MTMPSLGAVYIQEAESRERYIKKLEAEVERLRVESLSGFPPYYRLWQESQARLSERVAEVERLRAALTSIAKDGCGFHPPHEVCEVRSPKDFDDWCWSCLAQAALRGGEPPVGYLQHEWQAEREE
jgi:hypothetical protein